MKKSNVSCTDRSNPAGSSLRQHTHLCFYRQRCLSEASDAAIAATILLPVLLYIYSLFSRTSHTDDSDSNE